jgi:membrane-bound serine protease (ClpP class)
MGQLRLLLRVGYLAMILLGLALPLANPALAAPQLQDEPQAGSETRLVYVLTFQGAVTPVLRKYIADGIEAAVAADAEAVILQLDTPGGSVDVTKSINQTILAAPVPVVVYVAPAAAQAGSAGTFITLAAHVAAMAPGSSIGAASPVSAGGEDVGETMEAKVINILSADIENLAQRRGERAVEWAVRAVQEAAAATSEQALDLGVIDFIAQDVGDLLEQMDGFVVTVQGQEVRLRTADAVTGRLDLSPLQEFLNFISNPTIAAILLTLGSAGLLAEVWNPGTWIPGTIGLISLLLALYALGQLDANFAGLALIVVAIVLFVAEAFTPAFGALAFGGAAAFVLGSAILFDAPGLQVPWATILALGAGMAAFAFFAGGKALAIQRRPALTGVEGLIGGAASVRQGFSTGETGKVFVAGEWWNARLVEGAVEKGEDVEIVGRQGYTLLVKRKL